MSSTSSAKHPVLMRPEKRSFKALHLTTFTEQTLTMALADLRT